MTRQLKHDQVSTTTEQILNVLLNYRRALVPAAERDYLPQWEQIRRLVQTDMPIQLTLPAFPCKSPNLEKVLGDLPDMAERLSLRFLNRLCDEIGKIYRPGARVLICSDGHVFGDLIRVSDNTITSYTNAFIDMIVEEQISCIDLFQLNHVYPRAGFDEQRALLIEEWSRELATLREEVITTASQNQLYCGLTRFLFEDLASSSKQSKSALQRHCRSRALAVMQRSEAWGKLIAYHHPCAVRLSIHPQPPNSNKLGIMLLDAPDIWMTPWHAVLVQAKQGPVLMKHAEAKRVATLVQVNGRPSHYAMSDTMQQLTASLPEL